MVRRARADLDLDRRSAALTDVDADPIIDQGRVYALGQGGRMAAYELVTGQRIWELNLAGISTPAVAGEWIFTLTDDARLLAIARNTGRVRWITQLERYRNEEKRKGPIFWTGPVLAGNRLWVANSRGEVLVGQRERRRGQRRSPALTTASRCRRWSPTRRSTSSTTAAGLQRSVERSRARALSALRGFGCERTRVAPPEPWP